ncbi:MAG: glyoxalase [Rhodospirillaceae bacterium]|nr:glyoxalase [Rhodospirillaceae bacterium]
MIKVTDIAYARFRAPDLDAMEAFLEDFGLARSARTDNALYMRATDEDHHVHVTELGDKAQFIGPAFNAASEEDLQAIAQAPGASDVEDINEPGGGKRVRLTDPDGFEVEIVHGIKRLSRLPVNNSFKSNSGDDVRRQGDFVRLDSGPARCKRVGHIVLNTTDFKASDTFYGSNFGFVHSDECINDEGETIFAFNRVDQGKEFVDHHTLLTVPMEKAGLGHLAFEVEDVNAVHMGHEYLKHKGYHHSWGIGRHILGSQIFDYWFDPNGFRVEHWTDGDLLNEDTPMGTSPAATALDVQWGAGPETRLVDIP